MLQTLFSSLFFLNITFKAVKKNNDDDRNSKLVQ